jgi:integrase
MASDLARVAPLSHLDPKVAERILGARSPSTWERYQRALARLADWSERRQLSVEVPIQAETIAAWISSLADDGLSASTLRVSASAVSAIHVVAGYESPVLHPQVRQLLLGATRERREARPVREADPLLAEHLQAILDRVLAQDDFYDRRPLMLSRDVAVLLVGWAGGFRRSELAQLSFDQVRWDDDSIIIRLETSKRSKDPHERRIVRSETELCPIHALEGWCEDAGIDDGYVFRRLYRDSINEAPISGASVDAIVRRFASRLPKVKGRKPRYSAHSLRAGLATTASLAGKSDRDIASHLAHRSIATTARYIRTAKVRKSDLTRGLL